MIAVKLPSNPSDPCNTRWIQLGVTSIDLFCDWMDHQKRNKRRW